MSEVSPHCNLPTGMVFPFIDRDNMDEEIFRIAAEIIELNVAYLESCSPLTPEGEDVVIRALLGEDLTDAEKQSLVQTAMLSEQHMNNHKLFGPDRYGTLTQFGWEIEQES
jgi:hypothetical protein